MKKFLLILAVVGLTVGFLAPVPEAESKLKSYYSGDAINYNGNIVVGSSNTGSLELFVMREDNALVKFATAKALDPRFGKQLNFNDMIFSKQDGRLYAYAIEPRSMYKYDISDLQHAILVDQVNDTTWDWFAELDDISGYIATVGYRGVKIWNKDLQVINSYDIRNPEYQYNITSAQSDKFIFNIVSGKVAIYDKETRKVVKEFNISKQWENRLYHHQIYNDKVDGSIFIADDSALKKFNLDGEIEKSFQYTGPFGYDVTPSYDARYVYFSNGIGIVKLTKEDLSVVAYEYTTSIANFGGWAMGLKVVKDASGKEKVVLFNGSNILVLDGDLKPLPQGEFNIAFVPATEEDDYPEFVEQKMFLNVDKNRAPSGSDILLSGGGFARNEGINIDFAGKKYTATTGLDGRFSTIIKVPSVVKAPTAPHYYTDIKVNGVNSKANYSISFDIEF